MKLYVNGVLVHTATGVISRSVDTGKFTKLVLGRDEELSPSVLENYDVHIDDFTIWLQALSDAEIAYVMTQSRLLSQYSFRISCWPSIV